ncbi:uncharacterized protein LOC112562389 [Pomacea canaliculata]|uniref:uncharacterized protein LOC112562389 n=1 Tax=Pomacea canaliculata TaxID=400727 RepID=UPI000D7294CC|nr:uncharacterized protein LOC112562389 [Pomacea canaliculata]
MAIIFIVLSVMSIEFSTGQDCLRRDSYPNIPRNETDQNVTYYCSDVTKNAIITINNSCKCLTPDEAVKDWADTTMDKGRMCSQKSCPSGEVSCSEVTAGSKVFSCTNTQSIRSVVFNTSNSNSVGCRCWGYPAPVLPPDAYVFPLNRKYTSSGEQCLYGALCDDNPTRIISLNDNVYCCYNSRGVSITSINDSTMGCTCSNEFQGAYLVSFFSNQRSLPNTQLRCWTNAACPPGDNPTSVTTDGVTYCCPDLRSMPHLQIFEGTTRRYLCTCTSLPQATNQTTGQAKGQVPQVTPSMHLCVVVGLFASLFGNYAG